MTSEEFIKFRDEFNTECESTLLNKGIEYAGRADRLNNFKSVAARAGMTPVQVWSIYALKHLDSIMSYVREGRVFSESIRSRFMDARNYLDLGLALVEELSEQEAEQNNRKLTLSEQFHSVPVNVCAGGLNDAF